MIIDSYKQPVVPPVCDYCGGLASWWLHEKFEDRSWRRTATCDQHMPSNVPEFPPSQVTP